MWGDQVVRHFSSDLVWQGVRSAEVTLGWLLMDTRGSGGGGLGKVSRQWEVACLRLGGRGGSHAGYSWGSEEVIMVGWF